MDKTILFVDDDKDTSEIFVDYLVQNGFNVSFFQDPEEALLNYRSIKPDIVLLDVQMPMVSGFEIAKKIKEKDRNIPILFFSGTPGHENAVKGLKIGANDYIRKDVHLDELCARINKELDKNLIRSGDRLNLTTDTYVDIYTKKLVSCGVTQKFTENEFQILLELAYNLNALVDRKNILSDILKDNYGSDNYLYKTITKIRSTIKNDKSLKLESIWESITLTADNLTPNI